MKHSIISILALVLTSPAALYHAVRVSSQAATNLPVYPNDHLSWEDIPYDWCEIDEPKFAKFKKFMDCPQATLLAMSEVARFLTEARDNDRRDAEQFIADRSVYGFEE